jgi:hypothetical protein
MINARRLAQSAQFFAVIPFASLGFTVIMLRCHLVFGPREKHDALRALRLNRSPLITP